MPSASPSRASSTSSLLYMRTPSPGPPRSRSNFLSASPDDLREHVPLVADEAAAQPHDRLVQPQADDGERDEDDKLARPREPVAVREYVPHRCRSLLLYTQIEINNLISPNLGILFMHILYQPILPLPHIHSRR